MIEIDLEVAREMNLKLIGRVSDSDFSKIILIMERFQEDPRIKYYVMDLILYNEVNQKGEFVVSFWGD